MSVVKGFLGLHASFACMQVEVDNGHGLLDAPLVLFQYCGIRIGRWSFLGSVHNIPKIHGYQQHFAFEFLNVKVSFIELVNDTSAFAIKWYHPTLGCTLKIFKTSFSWPTTTQPKLKDNFLHSKYVFTPQCSGNMPTCFQMNLLVSKMLDLLFLKRDLKTFKSFKLDPPYLKYLKLDLFHLKRVLKILKSFK